MRFALLSEPALSRAKGPNQQFLPLLPRAGIFSRLPRDSFSFYVAISILAHLFFLGVLFAIALTKQDSSMSSIWQKNDMILRVADDIYEVAKKSGPSAKEISSEQVMSLLQKIYDRLILSPELTKEERSEILRKIMEISFATDENNHLIADVNFEADAERLIDRVARNGWKLSSGAWVEMLPATFSGQIEVHKIRQEELDILSGVIKRQFPEKDRYFSKPEMISVETEGGPEEVPPEYYYRSAPYRQITAMGGHLFSIIREGFLPEKSEYLNDLSSPANLPVRQTTSQPGSGFQLVFIGAPSSAADKQKLAKLRLSDFEIKKILDGLMAMDIKEQLHVFKKQYLDNYDWDSEELARLTRSFLFNNLNGVFFVLDTVPGTFDAIEELYYKRPAYDFIADLTGLFPGTKTDAELSLYLVSALDFERSTLIRLLESESETDDIISGRKRPANVFEPEIKALVVKQVYQDFLRLSQILKLSSDGILDWYLKRQEQIYTRLIEGGGETKNRALYNWGKSLWVRGQYEQAIEKWNRMSPDFPIPMRNYWEINSLLNRYGLIQYTRQFIDEGFNLENINCRDQLLKRHLAFHTWQKRSESNKGVELR